MARYKTFIRSARNFSELARARKITRETGLSYAEARERCQAFNDNRTSAQVTRGTKMEFTEQ